MNDQENYKLFYIKFVDIKSSYCVYDSAYIFLE